MRRRLPGFITRADCELLPARWGGYGLPPAMVRRTSEAENDWAVNLDQTGLWLDIKGMHMTLHIIRSGRQVAISQFHCAQDFGDDPIDEVFFDDANEMDSTHAFRR